MKVSLLNITWMVFIAMLCSANFMNAQELNVQFLGRYSTGIFDEGASEIVDYHAASQTIFSTNSDANTVDAVDISEPNSPKLNFSIDLSPYGGGVNSVAVLDNGIAVAIEAEVKQDPGVVAFFDFDGNFINQVTVGALPDMLIATHDGNKLLVANEGEPDDDYVVDPIGSVSIIDLTVGLASVGAANVTTLDFTGVVEADIPGVRIFGPGASIAQDMEPEYIAVSDDNSMAWVICQENNALAAIDLSDNSWAGITALGTKDHSLAGNGIDASNRDDAINIANWPVHGFYHPDAITSYSVDGNHYVVLANEGDSRDYDGFSEEERVEDVDLDPTAFPNGAELQDEANLGRLKITTTAGDIDNDGDFDELYSYGSRSFSIRDAAGNLVYDSGDDFEQITSSILGDNFNSNNDENDSFDSRSDDKGPEPEAVEVAEINGEMYAFIGLERVGGIMIYNVSDPIAPVFVQYLNSRDFSGDIEANGSDSGVENIRFIDAGESPTGYPMLAASNEVSGTISLFQITIPETYTLQVLHASDLEGGVDAIGRAKDFAAIIDVLEEEQQNTVILSAGDNYIPGPFFNASADGSMRPIFQSVYQDLLGDPSLTNVREGVGRADISIMNIIGFDASAVGNHEFDAGPDTYESIIEEDVRTGPDVRWLGSRFPYLSANLDFSADGDLGNLFTSSIQSNQNFILDPYTDTSIPKLAPATTIMRNGELIGVVGATTQVIESISSTGNVKVIGSNTNDMNALADVIQPTIDYMKNLGVNKIILISHLQQIALEEELIGLLHDVDIVIAGGSDTILADGDDELAPGDVAEGDYPLLTQNADADPALIVSTDGEYSYVGRLVVDFDSEGVIIPASLDESVSGIYIASSEKVTELWGAEDPFAEGTKGELVSRLTDAVQAIVIAKDGNIFGKTDVYINGERSFVRSQETNLGSLTADANLWLARQVFDDVEVSLKNGGGIRASIGQVEETSPGVFEFLPPQANPLSGKQDNEISQLDIENVLRFNNGLSVIELSAEDLKEVLEVGLSGAGPGATPGAFPQIAGISFTYSPSLPVGNRIITLDLTDENDESIESIVANRQVVSEQGRVFKVVTLNFLADGGDGYPYPDLGENRINLYELGLDEGPATFSGSGREQDALAEYLFTLHSETPFNKADTDPKDDKRIKVIGGEECDYTLETSEDMIVYYGYNALECTNLSAEVIDATSDVNLEWSTGETSSSIEVCPEETTSYTVIANDESGCSAIAAVDVCVENVVCRNPDLERVSVCFQYAIDGDVLFQINMCMSQSGAANWVGLEHPRYSFTLGLCGSEACAEYKSLEADGKYGEVGSMFIESEAQLLKFLAELSSDLSIYPNPATDVLNVELETLEEFRKVYFTVYDALGNVVDQRFIGTVSKDSFSREVLNINNYETGMYLIQVTSDNMPISTKRFTVIR